MNLVIEDHSDVAVATYPEKVLDADNHEEFKADLTRLVKERRKVLLDLENVEFIDSSGLGALLSGLRVAMSNNGSLKLCSMAKTVRAMFELVRMHKVFDVFENREDALASFDGRH